MKQVKERNLRDSQNDSVRVPLNSLKNLNFNKMKTTNNVQQTILKSMAVIVSFVLVSFTVSAQGFWESLLENNTFNEIALAMVEVNSESKETSTNIDGTTKVDAFEYLLEEAAEEVLELEDWMTDEAYFTGTFLNIETESDETLEVEDWMLDSTRFDSSTKKSEVIRRGQYIIGRNFIYKDVDEKEKELKLESWMVSDKVWRN